MSSHNGKSLAIIPARGGSKGIPRKNIAPIGGKPLVAWTIEAAQGARNIERVVVSTDDPEIAQIARNFGAEVVHRPAEISGDTASSESALLHVLEELEQSQRYRPELLVFLQCTSPLTTAQDIEGTISALREADADSALSVAPFHHFLWRPDGRGSSIGINHDKSFRPRRQDREPEYVETGAVYVMNTDGFRTARHRFFGKTATFVVPAERAIEIDEPRDLIIAETLLRLRQQEDRRALLPKPVRAVVFDFDGVFTDNSVWLDQDGREAVVCRRDDGMGIRRLKETGTPILVLSAETNPVVAARCRKLELECIQGCRDKLPALKQWVSTHGIDRSGLIYAGNDINDVECLRWAGCGVTVADAVDDARRSSRIVLSRDGGRGAVRELCDLVIESLTQSQRSSDYQCKAA
jgi:YrbI family 3-deoxy-D-manno-octulosonate 8-phosphate phosphatase